MDNEYNGYVVGWELSRKKSKVIALKIARNYNLNKVLEISCFSCTSGI